MANEGPTVISEVFQFVGMAGLDVLKSNLLSPDEWPTENATWDDLSNTSKWSCVRAGIEHFNTLQSQLAATTAKLEKAEAELEGLREVVEKYADTDNWGYYDDSGCSKGHGSSTDACFLGPECAITALAARTTEGVE